MPRVLAPSSFSASPPDSGSREHVKPGATNGGGTKTGERLLFQSTEAVRYTGAAAAIKTQQGLRAKL